jgi:hypothetical protein
MRFWRWKLASIFSFFEYSINEEKKSPFFERRGAAQMFARQISALSRRTANDYDYYPFVARPMNSPGHLGGGRMRGSGLYDNLSFRFVAKLDDSAACFGFDA